MADPFQVLKTRGHVFGESGGRLTTGTSGDSDDSGSAARRHVHRQMSGSGVARPDLRVPFDLMRSRRVGLSRVACASCQAPLNDGICRHARSCQVDAHDEHRFGRQITGPLASHETSQDVGWEWVGDQALAR